MKTKSILALLTVYLTIRLAQNTITCEEALKNFEGYECLDNGVEFGSGAFGKAYKVRDIETKEVCILKVATKLDETDINEIEALMDLKDKGNIIQVRKVKKDWDFNYIILEFGENGDLDKFMRKNKFKTKKDLLQMFKGIVKGVQHIHAKGYVHRDLKTENIVVTKKFIPKIIDFGVVGKIDHFEYIAGTLNYVAPEINFSVNRQVTKAEFDLYSLGVILYELETGKLPFKDTNMAKFNYFKSRGIYPLKAGMNKQVVSIIQKLLRVNPQERINLADLLEMIDGYIKADKWDYLTKSEYVTEDGEFYWYYIPNFSLLYILQFFLFVICLLSAKMIGKKFIAKFGEDKEDKEVQLKDVENGV